MASDSRPLVSVIVPAHDVESTLRECLTAVLEQDYPRVEVVVVDDGSTDATPDVAASFGSSIRFHRFADNRGRGAARNAAVAMATGELLAIQDADDVSRPNRLSLTVPVMADEGVVVVGGQADCLDRHLGRWRLRRWPTDEAEIRTALASGDMPVCHGASLIRREAFERVGGYRTDLLRAQDLDLVRRLAPLGSIRGVHDVVLDYRHDVVLPYAYWEASRRFARSAVSGCPPEQPLPLRDRARYPLAMCRRAAWYASSRLDLG